MIEVTQETELKIKSYIRSYADKHHITYDEAKEHAICKIVSLYFGEDKNNHDRDDVSR